MFTRRQFVIGATATGISLIIPSFANRVLQYVEETGAPLLESISTPSTFLRPAFIHRCDKYKYLLEDVAVADEPPEYITWQALFENMGITLEEGLEKWEVDPSHINEEADDELVDAWWYVSDCPSVHALRRLKEYQNDLVTEFEWDDETSFRVHGEKYTSSFKFIEGGKNICDLNGVQATDDVALSFLQHQLNRLGSGIKIEAPKNKEAEEKLGAYLAWKRKHHREMRERDSLRKYQESLQTSHPSSQEDE